MDSAAGRTVRVDGRDMTLVDAYQKAAELSLVVDVLDGRRDADGRLRPHDQAEYDGTSRLLGRIELALERLYFERRFPTGAPQVLETLGHWSFLMSRKPARPSVTAERPMR